MEQASKSTFLNHRVSFSLLMLIFYGAGGILFPVLPLFLSKTLSTEQVGFLIAIGPFATITCQLMWGWLADRFGLTRTLSISIFGSILSSLGFFISESFFHFVLTFIVYFAFSCSTSSLIDTYALARNNESFGKIRLWGAIGYGIAVIFSGVSLGWVMFMIHSILLSISLVIVLVFSRFTEEPNESDKSENKLENKVTFQGALAIFKNFRLIVILFLLFLVFSAVKAHDTFFAYGLDVLHASGWLIGIAWAFGVFPEIWMFIWIDRLGEKRKNSWILIVGAIVYACRLSLLGWSNHLWVWAISQFFEAVAFCFLYVGSIKTIYDIVPKAYKATGQSMFSIFVYGFSGISGSYLSGLIVQQSNVFFLYKTAAMVTLIALVGFIILFNMGNKEKRSLHS